MTCYTDIDYESFPIADLDLDLHWIQLPNSVLAARRQAKLLPWRRPAKKLCRSSTKYLWSPPTLYSPTEEDLWPVFTHTVHQCLTKFPEVSPRRQRRHRSTPRRAPRLAQPLPRQLRNALPIQNEKINSRNEPGDLIQNNHFEPRQPDPNPTPANPAKGSTGCSFSNRV